MASNAALLVAANAAAIGNRIEAAEAALRGARESLKLVVTGRGLDRMMAIKALSQNLNEVKRIAGQALSHI